MSTTKSLTILLICYYCLICVDSFISKVSIRGKFSFLSLSGISAPLQNDLMIRAAKGEKVNKTPVWIFRQAGRHLPEYNQYKSDKQKNFLQLLDDPVDVAECTMQPIRRYDVDAAILFSDILVILQALGIEVSMPGGLGITVPTPLKEAAEVKSRLPKSVDVNVKLSHVIEAVKLIKIELNGKVPLIGFSAAPWTLMYYMVGGSTKKNQGVASSWLINSPEESKYLLDLLTTIVIDYTSAQIEAGADMIQIFEAMGDFISEKDFNQWALPCMSQISSSLKARYPHIPLLVFPRGASYAITSLQKAGYDIVTLDTVANRKESRQRLEDSAAIDNTPRVAGVQGNFDVKLLKKGEGGGGASKEEVRAATRLMLEELGTQNLIANLGEGLTGLEDPELVAEFINSVHEISEEMCKSSSH